MTWHAITFTEEQISELAHNTFEDEFQLMYLSAGSPRGMSLFEVRSFPVHPIYYVSPESMKYAASLIEPFGPVPCNAPAAYDIILLAGDFFVPANIVASHLNLHTGRSGDAVRSH